MNQAIVATERLVTAGTPILVDFEDRTIEAIVIDPNGRGEGQPSIGLGFRMTERYVGIPHDTLSRWVKGGANLKEKALKLPSGKVLGVVQIRDEMNNLQLVVEANDWVSLAVDLLKTPGKLRASTKDKIADFISWFAVKGFYASAYTSLFGSYDRADDRAISIHLHQQAELQRLCLETEKYRAIAEQANLKRLEKSQAIASLHGPEMLALIQGRPEAIVTQEKVVERTVCVDSSGREIASFDGVGITYIQKMLGFKTTKQAWDWLESVGMGKNSSYWLQEIVPQSASRLPREFLPQIQQKWASHRGTRQLLLGEQEGESDLEVVG